LGPTGRKIGSQELRVILHSLYVQKYYQLTYFIVIVGMFDQKSNFQTRLV